MKNRFRIGGKRILKYSVLGIVSLLIENILLSIEALEFWNKNILFITVNGSLFSLAIFIIISMFFVFSQHSISSLHIWIKKHQEYLVFVSVVLEVLFLFKCDSTFKTVICMIEFGIVILLIDCETIKMYKYNLVETSAEGLTYVERPIIGRSNLTQSQCNALDQLKSIIDKRSSSDSFNIALIGAWGSGKTSITDTLIYEYEKEDNMYFLLKMSTLTLKETKNIVTYVRNYFEDLFRKYEIGIARRNVTFLTTLAHSFSGNLSIVDFLSYSNNNHFFDIEKEKELFAKQVSKLLKVSGRKNIIFFIDDTDRTDDEEQIIKLLSEFASIEGIITIVSLDKSKDMIIRPNISSCANNCVYNPIDKYIHIRIRISEDDHIEYDKSITKQIVSSFGSFVPKTNCFISCDGKNIKNSLFDCVKDYQTTEILNSSSFSGSTYNILTELFFYNMKYNNKEFGLYLEELINEYLYNTKELYPYIHQMLTTPPDMWKNELYTVNIQWTNSFGMKEFDWLRRLQSNSGTLFWMLCQTVEALDLICSVDIQSDVSNIQDVYDYFMIKNFPIDGRTWENRNERPVIYSGFEQIELIVFGKEQFQHLNQEINRGNFEFAKKLLVEKIEGVANLFLTSILLVDFMDYLRSILNNYRAFKMQLREAELLNLNYLDYLLKEWQPRENVRKILEKMKEENPILRNINLGFPSLCAFINNILFENYVLKFGNRFNNQELKDCRLFLYHGKEKPIIVIVKKQEPKNKYIFLDASGDSVLDMTKETMIEITKLYDNIW